MHRLQQGADVEDPLTPYLEVDRTPSRHECWVSGHMVAGLDGTAAIAGRVGALSTVPDQRLFRRMRELADVVLVGAQTVRSEGYGPVRLGASARASRVAQGRREVPPVAVVSRSLDLDWSAPVFSEAPGDARTIVVTCAAADAERRAAAGRVAEVVLAGESSVVPALALAELARRGHTMVLCEGGPRWLGEVVAADLLDELFLSLAPVMGGDPLPVAVTPLGAGLRRFVLAAALREDDTLFLRYERGSDE